MNRFAEKQLARVGKLLDRWMEKRTREVRLPESVSCLEDIPYRDTGKDCHKLDIYRPEKTEGTLPVILNLHGGGLVLCNRKVNRPFCAELARRGFLVFSVDYPLVPQAKVPEILSDVARAMDFVRDSIGEYGGDPERVYLVGDSAGAFLSVYELAAQKNGSLAQALGLIPGKLEVKAAAFISGMFYTAKMDSVGAFLRKDFYGKDWKSNPFRAFADPAVPEVAGAMPPCFLVTAKLDNLRPYTLAFCKGLKGAKAEYILRDLPLKPGLDHDFVIVKPEMPEAQTIMDEMCDFLRTC